MRVARLNPGRDPRLAWPLIAVAALALGSCRNSLRIDTARLGTDPGRILEIKPPTPDFAQFSRLDPA